jgi:hypothetical protein
MYMLDLAIFIFIGIPTIMYFIKKAIANSEKKAAEETRELRQKQITEWEASRGNSDFSYLVVRFNADDARKTGKLHYDEEIPEVYLVKLANGTVHFSQRPGVVMYDFLLMDIQYQGKYTHETTGNISSRSGSAFVGGALLGSTGAAMGASGSRQVSTTTIDQEIADWGMLVLERVDNGEQVAVQIMLTKELYQTLFKDFMWRGTVKPTSAMSKVEQHSEQDKTKPVEKHTPKVTHSPAWYQTHEKPSVTRTPEESSKRLENIKQLSSLHDSGILTDAEYADKVQQLMD